MILAADPGSEKTGMAVVEEDGSLVIKKVIRTKEFEKEAEDLLSGHPVSAFIMGNGTHHKEIQKRADAVLEKMGLPFRTILVDEKYTTEMGEQWYWEDHPTKGLSRLIPKGMRTVPVPIDDYVAWIIGCIYLGKVKAEDVGHKKV